MTLPSRSARVLPQDQRMNPGPRVSAWQALIPLFLSEQRFVDLAWRDALAANWAASDMRAHMRSGTWPTPQAEAEFRARVAAERQAQVGRLLKSAGLVLGAVSGAAAVAFLIGQVHPSLPTAWPKVLAVVSGGLMAWPTVMILGEPSQTIDGNSLMERMPAVLFQALFLPGFFLATFATLM